MSEPRRSRTSSGGRLYTTALAIVVAGIVTSAASALYITAGGSVLGVGAGTFGIAAADTATAAPADTIDPTLQRAREAAWAGNHQDAIAAYDTVLRIRPLDRDVAIERARVLGWAEEYGRAADALAALPSTMGTSGTTDATGGNNASDADADTAADADTEADAASDADLAIQRAQFLWWAGRSREADSLLSVVLEHRPDSKEALELQALVRPTVEPALDVATRWVAERPDDPWSNLWLARALVGEGRGAEALAPYSRALAEPGAVDPEVLLEAAGVGLGVDSLAFAGRVLDRYLQLVDPSDWDTRLRLARAYAWNRRYAAADDQYVILLERRPDAHDVRRERAQYLWAAGRPETAHAELTRILTASPGHPGVAELREEVRASMTPTARLARQWLAEEESVENRLLLARLLVEEGRHVAAMEHYDAALGDATDPALVTEAADAAHAAGDTDRVLALLERHVAAVDAPDADLLLRLARVYAWEARRADAVRTYAEYLAVRPDDVEARLERGRELAWGDSTGYAEARSELERVVAEDSTRTEASKLLADLDRWSAPVDVEVAVEPEAPVDMTRVAWAAELDAFTDTEGFDWLGTTVGGDWILSTGSLWLRLGHGYSAGRPALGDRLGSTGFGATVGGRWILAPRLTALGELGTVSFQDVDPFLTWGAGLEYDAGGGNMARVRYGRVPAVRDAATMAALQAGALMDRLHLEATRELGPWAAATDLQLQRFSAELGDADRYAGMVRLDRSLGETGVAVGGMVRGITATGRAPLLSGWGPLYWTPDHYIAPALSVRYGATVAPGLWIGLRAAPGIAFIDEGEVGGRYGRDRTAILEAGGSVGYRTGPWRFEVSGDWGGALPDGYNASSLRIQLSRLGGGR